jgi:hypothetical protein
MKEALLSGINWTEVLVGIGGLLSALILAGLRKLAVELTAWINQKAMNEKLKGALILGTDAVVQAVADVQHVVVQELKEASKDGKLTEEEIANIKTLAVLKAKANMGDTGVKLVQSALGFSVEQLEIWLSGRIEAIVAQNKNP